MIAVEQKAKKRIGVWLDGNFSLDCMSQRPHALRSFSILEFASGMTKRTLIWLKKTSWDLNFKSWLNRVEQDSFSDIWWLLTLPRLLSVTMIQYDLYIAILVDFRFSSTCFLYDATGFLTPNINMVQRWFWYASSIFFSCTFSQQLYWEVPHPAQCMSTFISLALHLYGRETNGGILRCEQSKLL